MAIERLRADLALLREEIAASDGSEPEALARLAALAEQVEAELGQEAALSDPAGFIEELEGSISGFEASHPNLAAVVNSILSTLGSMGV
jgi:Domain of unknown function (DUF4404)